MFNAPTPLLAGRRAAGGMLQTQIPGRSPWLATAGDLKTNMGIVTE
jgi:hypothetical protein